MKIATTTRVTPHTYDVEFSDKESPKTGISFSDLLSLLNSGYTIIIDQRDCRGTEEPEKYKMELIIESHEEGRCD